MDTNEKHFYGRMNQIGDYSNNNRLDTLFLFQITFIYILIVIILFYLGSVELLAHSSKWIIIACLSLTLIFVYINRIVIMNNIRDKTTWDRINFGDGSIVPENYVVDINAIAGGTKGTKQRYTCSQPVCSPIS